MVPAPVEHDPVLRLARRAAAAATVYHRARIEGAERLPDGPALLVGNHGLFGFETPVFFYLLHRATGRLPVGLADRKVFSPAPLRRILGRIGGVPGTPAHALALLEAGHLVVCYPGGAREVFKSPEAAYRLAWEGALGFARVAIRARVPVVPFAGLGVDESYFNLGHLPQLVRLLGRYALPFAVGLGPLPLPVRFRFRLGTPLSPPRDERRAAHLKLAVQASVENLLEDGPS